MGNVKSGNIGARRMHETRINKRFKGKIIRFNTAKEIEREHGIILTEESSLLPNSIQLDGKRCFLRKTDAHRITTTR